jgi:two-component system, NarL family, sensor histidine kinase UhpB
MVTRIAQAVEAKVEAERKAREAEARLDERRDLAHLVEQRVEEERRLVAHELQGKLAQSVTKIRSLALAIATQVGAKDPATEQAARRIAREAGSLYDAMHGLIPRLTPFSLDTLGLAETLESLVRDWQGRCPSIALSVRHDLSTELGSGLALAIYRVVQEGLINALRHAQPTRVDISVQSSTERILLILDDDGIGIPANWCRPGHFGLRGLTDRVDRLGGVLRVVRREPRGTRLTAQIPLNGTR